MGKEMKKLYKQNKSKIHFNRVNPDTQRDFSDDDSSGGFTSSNFLQEKGYMEINFVQNYTMYYTVAHEFMHMYESSRNFKSEKLSEGNSRFIEFLLGDYLQKRGIISNEECSSHSKANNNHGYFCAKDMSNCMTLLKLMKERADSIKSEKQEGISDEYVLDKDVIQAFLQKECSGDKGKLIDIVNNIYGDIKKGGSRSLQNKKRFINGMAVANLLYEIYQNNPKKFPRIYNEALKQENIKYEDFIETIQLIDVPREVKALPPRNQFLDDIRVNPFTMEENRKKSRAVDRRIHESQSIDKENYFDQ